MCRSDGFLKVAIVTGALVEESVPGPRIELRSHRATQAPSSTAPCTKNPHVHLARGTREHNGGRIFYTSLGVPEDFANENFRRMLTNAIFWTMHRDPERMKK